MENISISIEKASEMQDLYERKTAISDLCLLLASKNELVEEGNLFYNRLIEDNMNCTRRINQFWDDIKNKYSITLNKDEYLYLNFSTGVITMQIEEEC